MAKNIQAIRGMKDCLPEETVLWQYLERILKDVLSSYGYREIRLPIVEKTLLFQRAIGNITDIIEKEMYSFNDRNGDSITLRPEGTASCVRAGIEHGLFYNQEQRLWYSGPMFRYERPQKGRYRQFYQIGAEVFGYQGPDIDAEIILLTARWWRILGISKYVSLELNSIGSLETRTQYCDALVAFLSRNENKLDEDSRRRIHINPIKILDTKNPDVQLLLKDAPVIIDYLDKNSYTHFFGLCDLLDQAEIRYTINPRLVRGLDYYNRTVFEWVTTYLGSQNTICAGGRYDSLVKYLGGQATPAIGFATGLERLILLMREIQPNFIVTPYIDVYLGVVSESERNASLILLAEKLRDALPSLQLRINYSITSFKKHLKRAGKYGARIMLILEENENSDQKVILKDLKTNSEETLLKSDVIKKLIKILS